MRIFLAIILLAGTAFAQTPYTSPELETELIKSAQQNRAKFFKAVRDALLTAQTHPNTTVQDVGNALSDSILEDMGVIKVGENPDTVENYREAANKLEDILDDLVDPETVIDIMTAIKAEVQPEDRLPSPGLMSDIPRIINKFDNIDKDDSGGLTFQELKDVDKDNVLTQADFNVIDDNDDTVLTLFELQDLIT